MNGFVTSFKISQVSPVVDHGKSVAGRDMNLMIAIGLGDVVYIVLLYHGAVFLVYETKVYFVNILFLWETVIRRLYPIFFDAYIAPKSLQ
jgi:hypothetical protein